MTVKELIESLAAAPPDAEIWTGPDVIVAGWEDHPDFDDNRIRLILHARPIKNVKQ